jgi:excinuclease UvrABC nuclease subunit
MLINHIRDESHRFAIKNHRQKRGKKRTTSALEGIEGIGKARRTALLNHKYTNEVTTKVAAITWASLRFLPSSLLFIFQTT